MSKNKEIESILMKHKLDQITTNRAILELLLMFGEIRTKSCKLNRLSSECSIIRNTSFKSCEGCGHQII